MNFLDSQTSTAQAICRPTPVNIGDPGTSGSNSNQAMPQFQPSGTPVSFTSTTQVGSDILAPPTVNTAVPPPPTATARAPLSQIPSMARTTNSQQIAPPCWQLLTLAGNVEGRITPQTGAIRKLRTRNVKVRTMVLGSVL